MADPIDDFLGCALWRLRVARTARHTVTRYLDNRLIASVPSAEARDGILGITITVRVCAQGESTHTPEARAAYLNSLNRIVETFAEIEHQTPAQRLARFRYFTHYASAATVAAVETDDTAVWTELGDAFRALRDAWAGALAPLPYLADVWAFLAREDPEAFWGAYWDWMLHAPRAFRDARNRRAGALPSVDTYIAQLPQTVAALRDEASRAACQRALETELDDDDDWSMLMSDRARAALIATGVVVDPPPHVAARWGQP